MLLWVGAAAVTYFVCWPAMWVQPRQALATVIGGVIKHAGRAHPQPLYYLGRLVSEDPGAGYYLVSVLVKTTALSLPLFAVGLISPLTATWRRERTTIGLLIAYAAFFFIQMSLGAKKAPRYLLPAFPALAIVSGIGLVTLVRRFSSSTVRVVPGLVIAAALVVQGLLVLTYHPYYVIHASLLVGGPAGAQRLLLPTPEGEGLDQVARYLNVLADANQMRVGVQLPAREAFVQHFVGQTVDTRDADLDYLVFVPSYVKRGVAQDQWGEQWNGYRFRSPQFTAVLRGDPYAWVYKVDDDAQAPAAGLDVCLGEEIELTGYTIIRDGEQLRDQLIHPGDVLLLTLHWRARRTPDGEYSVFVHLLGPDGHIAVQQDNAPLNGARPTFSWQPGERLDDPYELVVPAEAPAGIYQLMTGMYDWRTGERLTATCRTPLPDNRVTLATLEVGPERWPWWRVPVSVLAAALALGGIGACLANPVRLRG
jgi:hypothetical protein